MAKASEDVLSKLHSAVAEVLTNQVTHQEEIVNYDEDGNEVGTGEHQYVASPATIAAAIKFLKDNDITADKKLNKNLSNLEEALSNKQKRSRLNDAQGAAKSLKVVGD